MFAKVIILAFLAVSCANAKPLLATLAAAPVVAAAPAVVTAQSSQYIARNYNGIAAAAYTAPVVSAAYTAAPVAAAYTAAYATSPYAAAYPYAAAPLAAAAYTAYPYVL